MPNHEDSPPIRDVAPGAENADDATGIRIGLAVQVLGGQLAEHFRIRRHLTRAQRGAAGARLVAILDSIGDDIDTLKIGVRAMTRRDLG